MWSKWSKSFLNQPVKSAPSVVAAAVLVGALFVLAHPAHSSQVALASTASLVSDQVLEPLLGQIQLMDQLVSEPLPTGMGSVGHPSAAMLLPPRESLETVIEAFDAVMTDAESAASPEPNSAAVPLGDDAP